MGKINNFRIFRKFKHTKTRSFENSDITVTIAKWWRDSYGAVYRREQVKTHLIPCILISKQKGNKRKLPLRMTTFITKYDCVKMYLKVSSFRGEKFSREFIFAKKGKFVKFSFRKIFKKRAIREKLFPPNALKEAFSRNSRKLVHHDITQYRSHARFAKICSREIFREGAIRENKFSRNFSEWHSRKFATGYR